MLPSDRVDVFLEEDDENGEDLADKVDLDEPDQFIAGQSNLSGLETHDSSILTTIDEDRPFFDVPLALFGYQNCLGEDEQDLVAKYRITKPLRSQFIKTIMGRLLVTKDFFTKIPVGLDLSACERLHNGFLRPTNVRRMFKTFEIPVGSSKKLTLNMTTFVPFFQREENILKHNSIPTSLPIEFELLFGTKSRPPYQYIIAETVEKPICKVLVASTDTAALINENPSAKVMLKYRTEIPTIVVNIEKPGSKSQQQSQISQQSKTELENHHRTSVAKLLGEMEKSVGTKTQLNVDDYPANAEFAQALTYFMQAYNIETLSGPATVAEFRERIDEALNVRENEIAENRDWSKNLDERLLTRNQYLRNWLI